MPAHLGYVETELIGHSQSSPTNNLSPVQLGSVGTSSSWQCPAEATPEVISSTCDTHNVGQKSFFQLAV